MPPIYSSNGLYPSNYFTCVLHIPMLIFSNLMSNFSLQVETALIYLVGCISILLRNILVQAFGCTGQLKEWYLFWLDFGSIILPMFLAQTFITDFLILFIAFQCVISALAFTFCGARVGVTPLRALRPLRVDSVRAIRDSQTMFRALLLNSTALAILAVDFSIFPRRLVKTHYYGQSLMDTGTAAFVFVNALADQSAEARGQCPRERILTATIRIPPFRVPTLLLLFLLGIGRSLFINFSGYSQDVTEYGVHWNFFITLFFIRVYVILVPPNLIIPIGLFAGFIYQLALSLTELEQWMLDTYNERKDFIEQNREGIFSLFGYFFIYSASLFYARLMANYLQKDRKLSPLRIFYLFGFSILCFIAQKIMEADSPCFGGLGLIASRRLANLPYCFAMMALFSATISLFHSIQIIVPLPQSKGGLVEAISRNALLHFLIANFLTGFVNIMMRFVIKIRGMILAETATMFVYSMLTSFLIFIIYLKKKRSQT